MRRAQTAKVPTLHGAGKALTNGVTRDIDLLASDEVIRRDRRADRKETFLVRHAEFGDLLLQANFSLRESFALRLVDVLVLRIPGTKLDREIAVAIGCAVSGDLTSFQRQNGHGNVTSILLKQAGHPDFFRDHASAHDQTPYRGTWGPFPRCLQPKFSKRRPVRAELFLQQSCENETGDAARLKSEDLPAVSLCLADLAIRRGHMEPRNSLISLASYQKDQDPNLRWGYAHH